MRPPTRLAGAALLMAALVRVAAQEADVPSLAEIYQPYFPVGAAVEPAVLRTARELLVRQVSSLTAENAMKWERIHPRPPGDAGEYDFAAGDDIVSFARQHGMNVRGHTLVWHQQTPTWVYQDAAGGEVTRTELLERMRAHIRTLLGRYRSRVYCWDVVNEALADGGGWRTDSPWHRIAGGDQDGDGLPDYLVVAFRSARHADPSAKLYYNDYNIESGPKLEAALRLARDLKALGLVDGVGIQGHWSVFDPDPEAVRRAIGRFAALGLEVQVTELDLSVYAWADRSSLPSLDRALEERQARRYGELFRVFREEAAAGRLQGVTLWGIADDATWLDNFPVRGRKNWPLLFDTDHRPKAAFWSVVRW